METKQILAIDDEEQLLDLYRDFFEIKDGKYKYKLVTISNPLDVTYEHFKNADLIISDFKMPHKDGIMLMEEMYSYGFEKPVIFVSGYMNDLLNSIRLQNIVEFIPKPFDPDILFELIEELVAQEDEYHKFVQKAYSSMFGREDIDSFNDFHQKIRSMRNMKILKFKDFSKKLLMQKKAS